MTPKALTAQANKLKKADLVKEFIKVKEQAAILQEQNTTAQHQIITLQRQFDAMRMRSDRQTDAVKYFADRYGISAEELVQLGLANGVVNNNGELEPIFTTEADLMGALKDDNITKQTAVKFRHLKKEVVAHFTAVNAILDRMDELGRKNHLSKEDYRKFNEYKRDVMNLVGR